MKTWPALAFEKTPFLVPFSIPGAFYETKWLALDPHITDQGESGAARSQASGRRVAWGPTQGVLAVGSQEKGSWLCKTSFRGEPN